MKTIFAIAALAAAGLASSGVNAESVHRQRSGIVRHTSATMADPASFQSLYQGASVANDCDGQRVFGFCPVR
jgi:hypothetical protein